MAGLKIIGGVDFDTGAVESYRRQFPDAVAHREDLSKVSAKAVLKALGLQRGDVDILVGGPPCQPYSVNNHQRGVEDERSSLIERFLEFATILCPRSIVVENVPGLTSIEEGRFLNSIIRSFRARGYRVEFGILDAVRFGVPQRRKRLVLIGTRGQKQPSKILESLKSRTTRARTVGEALGDLPVETGDLSPYTKPPTNAFQRVMRQDNKNLITSRRFLKE